MTLKATRVAVAILLAVVVSSPPTLAQQAPATPAVTEPQLIAKGGRRLGGKDFQAMYIGNTLTGTTSDGEAFHVFVESATSYKMRFQGKDTADKWSIGSAGEFCTTADGDTLCTSEVLADGTLYSFNPDGSLAGTAKVRPGNPEKL